MMSDFDTSLQLKYFPQEDKSKEIPTQALWVPGGRQLALDAGEVSPTHRPL
jgi:hypothetical protein